MLDIAGDETVRNDDLDLSMDFSAVLRVETIHISSPILAAKSPFFYKVKYLDTTSCICLF